MGATVEVSEGNGRARATETADNEGNFRHAHLLPGPAKVHVSASGFQYLERNVLVGATSLPVILELKPEEPSRGGEPRQPSVRLSGTVVDAVSGEPLPRFAVLIDELRGVSRDLLGEGRNGAFDWAYPLPYAVQYTLEINADGYEPQVSSIRQHGEGDQIFEFRLTKGGSISGQVLQPDGHPAAGAMLGLGGEGFALRFEPPAKLINLGHPVNQTKADSEGIFVLKSMVGMNALLIVHDTGCAAVARASGESNVVVQLEPWGTIKGTLYIGNTPAAGQTVDVGFRSRAYASDAPRLAFDLMAKTDNEGRFRFERVPPGNHTVYRYISDHEGKPGEIGFSHGEPVTVRPGETSEVTIGGKGQAVTGRFALSQPVTNYDWKAKLVALIEERPDLVAPKMEQFPNNSAFFKALNGYNASFGKYYLRFDPDGSFRVDDVLPGQYTVAIRVTAPPADPLDEDAWLHPGPELGGITNTVIVPSTSSGQTGEPVDLGVVRIPINDRASKEGNLLNR